jgi:hypothetical protein
MKLKDLIITEDELQPQIHKNYDDFIEDSDIPKNSIVFDEEGRIVSNKLSLLNFIDFLLTQYDYLPESNKYKESDNDEGKSNKKKRNHNKSYNELTLKQKKKRMAVV